MTILLVGLNHQTTPVELREKFTLSDDALQNAYLELRNQIEVMTEVVILSTCNRLELYASTEHIEDAILLLEQFLSGLQEIPSVELKTHLYNRSGDEAILHLMRVACGLDSLILGESQILGQVTQAFEQAHEAGAAGAILSHLFAEAIHSGKRARNETAISRYSTSVSHAGARLLIEQLPQSSTHHVLIIGAGEMALLAAQALKRFDVHNLTFINRTYDKAEALALEFDGKALDWYQLKDALLWADAIICATGAPHIVIYQRDIERVLGERHNRPLVIMDIAVPRDVEASVGKLPDVHYYDIDDLQMVVDANEELREAAVPQVEIIIQQQLARFAEWYRGREVTPVIKDLRAWAQSVAEDELVHALNRLSDSDERTRQVVSLMAHRLVNRLLHEPTSRLRIQANEGNGYGYAHAVRELFALEDVNPAECQHDPIRCGAANQCDLQCITPASVETRL